MTDTALQGPGNTGVISVVDDDQSLREALVDLLGSMGLAARAFPNAEAFLASAERQTTSCLVTDIQMPGMSGLELGRRVVESDRPIPTILITAYPDERVRANALRAGIARYLVKPFGEEELIGSIRSAVASRSAARRILLLHPVETDRNYFRTVLSDHGFDVVLATERDDLFAAARQRRPALMLIHAMRLDMLRAVQAVAEFAGIPTAVIASYSRDYLEEWMRQNGVAVPIVPVPINATELAAMIDEIAG
jgi:CheY-like chemotaxis protein